MKLLKGKVSGLVFVFLLISILILVFNVQRVKAGLIGTHPVLSLENNTHILHVTDPFYRTTMNGTFMVGQIMEGQWLWIESYDNIVAPPGGLIGEHPIHLQHDVQEGCELVFSFTAEMINDEGFVGNAYGFLEGEIPPEQEPPVALFLELPLADPRPTPIAVYAYASPPTEVGSGVVSLMYHDVAVTDLTPYKTVVGEGFTMPINLTLKNQGNYSENFNIKLYANKTVIGDYNMTLTSGNSSTITSTWYTIGFAKGNYTISAYAALPPGEINVINNNYTDGSVIVAIVGDITGPDGWPDGKVDIRDIGHCAIRYGCIYQPQIYPPPPCWDPNCDINSDGKIDIRDIALIAIHYGEVYP